MADILKNKVHYYKSELGKSGYTAINVYSSQDGDTIESATFNDLTLNRPMFLQANFWNKKTDAQVIRKSTDGYGLPADFKAPSVAIGVADNITASTDLLKVQVKPSIISTDGTNYKTDTPCAFKLLSVVQETSPFDTPVAVGTDTCKLYIVLMLDNTLGAYTNARNFSSLVSPFLQNGEINWIYENKSKTGYRGTAGVGFPVHVAIDSDPSKIGTAETRDNILTKWQFKFNQALDPVVSSFIIKEGTTKDDKFYRMSMITFGGFSGSGVSEFHEQKMTTGLGIKGCIGVYQLADTEEDKANFVDVSILPSTGAFDTRADGSQKSQAIMDTLAGQALVATTNLQYLTLNETSSSMTTGIYTLGICRALSYLFDITIGDHADSDIPTGISIITKFEERKDWSGVSTSIALNAALSGADTPYTVPSPVVCYSIPDINPEITDAVGTLPAPAKPNRLYFVEARDCLAFSTDDVTTVWNNSLAATENWTTAEREAVRSTLESTQDYNTGLYSYNTIIAAIKSVYYARAKTNMSDDRVNVYETIFKTIWNGTSAVDIEKDAYEIECWQSFFATEPISLAGLTENSNLDSPCYLLWGDLTQINIPISQHTHDATDIVGYYPPKGYVGDIGTLLIGSKALSSSEIAADLEYARVWHDITGYSDLESNLISDLYTLKEYRDGTVNANPPKLDTTRSTFFKNLCYGRVKEKLPIGAWRFMNCHIDAWAVEDSFITEAWWEKGENFDTYLHYEESTNPDLGCTTVSFRVREGVIATDYFKNPDHEKIYASIYYCAKGRNNVQTRKEFRFEIVAPVVLGMIERLQQHTGITNNVWGAGVFNNVGQIWRKKWVNRTLTELDEMGIQPKDGLFHINNVAVCVTPRFIAYSTNTSKQYEVPMLAIPPAVLEAERPLAMDARKYTSIEVTDTGGTSHSIPVSPMVNDTIGAKVKTKSTAETGSKYGGVDTGLSYGGDYSLSYGVLGIELGHPTAPHLVDFSKGVYIRSRVLVTSYECKSYGDKDAQYSLSPLCPVYLDSSNGLDADASMTTRATPQLRLAPLNAQYSSTDSGYSAEITSGQRVSSFKDETSNAFFTEFCDTRYGAEGFPIADKWLWTEQIYIPASDKTGCAYLVYRWMWEGTGFTEADLLDNSKWKEVYAEAKDGYLIYQKGSRPIHFVADGETFISDLSSIKIYQIDGLITTESLPKATASDTSATRIANTASYATAIYAALGSLDTSVTAGTLTPKYDITRNECRYGEFIQYDSDNNAVGYNVMTPTAAMIGFSEVGTSVTASDNSTTAEVAKYSGEAGRRADWFYGDDVNWFRSGESAFASYLPQVNMNYSGQVEGFQPLDFEAIIINRDTNTYYLPKSRFSTWLDQEAGLPYCSDYNRQVMMRKVKADDPTETRKCWALYDSLNYELTQGRSATQPPTLTRHDGREWSSRNDFMYDVFTFNPRHHYMRFEFETRDVTNNKQYRYRFMAVSMGEFEVTPADIIKQLRGKSSTEQIVCIKGWGLDAVNFFRPSSGTSLLGAGETTKFIGSCRITNADKSIEYVNTGASDDVLGYYTINTTEATARVFSVPHRAFSGVYNPTGSFEFSATTQKFVGKLYQDNDGSLKQEYYSGYWLSAFPVTARKRTATAEYDTSANYDTTFTDWFINESSENKVTNAIARTGGTALYSVTRALDGASTTLLNRTDLEWCVTGGAPSTRDVGRVPADPCYATDWSWTGKLGYIPARFIGANTDLITSQLGMMSIENSQLTQARWQMWEIEAMGKISTYASACLMPITYNTANTKVTPAFSELTGHNGNWLPSADTSLAYNNILQSFCAGGVAYGYWNVSGVGAVEYTISNMIKTGRVLGTTKCAVRPLIDYRYFNPTKDSASVTGHLVAPNNVGTLNVSLYGNGMSASVSQWRGMSFHVGGAQAQRVSGTEKTIYNTANALGHTGGVLMVYAPYGYDTPLGLSTNKNSADTSGTYGYNPKNNPRLKVAIGVKLPIQEARVYTEGVGNPAFATSNNWIVNNNATLQAIKAMPFFLRDTQRVGYEKAGDHWNNLSFVSVSMGTHDGTVGVGKLHDFGTRGGAALNDTDYGRAHIFLNFPSVWSPFNFSLEHTEVSDYLPKVFTGATIVDTASTTRVFGFAPSSHDSTSDPDAYANRVAWFNNNVGAFNTIFAK